MVIEVEGEAQLADFAGRRHDEPPRSVIGAVDVAQLDPVGYAASRSVSGRRA
ncbi:MAG: hypothetical protein U0641_03140 [Anaerolineae bacterium]